MHKKYLAHRKSLRHAKLSVKAACVCRVNHLSDVMPLLVHFHSVHAQLQSSLAELQTRLDAVDVPIGGGANTETIRTELRDAQVRDDHTATAECPSVCLSRRST